MQRLFLGFALCLWLGLTHAQTLQEFTYLGDRFHKERYINFSAELVMLANPKAIGNPQDHRVNQPFIEAYFLKPDFSKGGLNRRVDYKLLSDIFWLFKQITEKDETKLYANIGSTISGGILGWHMYHWNVLAKPKQTLSLGFTLNDYFIGAIYPDTANGGIMLLEPQGWQIGAGPAMGFARQLSPAFLLMGSGSYVLNFSRPVSVTYAKEDNSYPKPHMLHTQLTLMSKWGLFAEAQFVQLINRGNIPNNTRRLDLKLGFAFVL